ncbi:hypothetical protein BH18ACT9_BH18ACT9_20370 [soil metagenome]
MSESGNEHEPAEQASGDNQTREDPEIGLIADEDLPEELRPDDDNPLAQQPEEQDSSDEEPRAEGMPDMGQPG